MLLQIQIDDEEKKNLKFLIWVISRTGCKALLTFGHAMASCCDCFCFICSNLLTWSNFLSKIDFDARTIFSIGQFEMYISTQLNGEINDLICFYFTTNKNFKVLSCDFDLTTKIHKQTNK